MRKVVIIGLDCATPDILFTDFLDELPHLRRLVKGGTHGTIRSTDPPITVPAWTVMTSSKNPGRHGFFGFRNRRRGAYADGFLATGNDVRAKRVWDYLSEAGYRVSVHAVPQTFPAYPVNGVMTACFLTPDTTHPGFAYPAAAKALVDEVRPDYAVDVRDFRTDDKAKLVRSVRACTDDHFDAAEAFVERFEWDFFMMVEMGVDRIQHGMWDHREAVLDHYRHVDARVGRLLDKAPRDAVVVVVSDHGAKKMEGAINLNDWLLKEGLLALRRDLTAPTKFREEDVDWSRTKAWAYGGYHARIFVNLQGREPEGTVAPEDYEAFLDDLASRIRAIPGPDGKPLPGTAVRRPSEEYGAWPDLDLRAAPDLHAYLGDLSWRVTQSVGNPTLWSAESEVGPDGATHDWHGVFALFDPLHPAERRVEGLHIADVCPTILRLFGIPPPDDLEGRAVQGVAYPPIAHAQPSSARDMRKLGPLAGARVAGPSAHKDLGDAASRTSGVKEAMRREAR